MVLPVSSGGDMHNKSFAKGILFALIVVGLLAARVQEHEGWDDLRFPLTRNKQGQNDKPDYDFTNMGLLFPQNDATEIVYLTFQMPHSWKLASSIEPHIHYVQDEAQQPVFKIDHRCFSNNSDPTIAFSTITCSDFAFTYTSGSLLQIIGCPTVSMVGIGLSGICDFKIYRDDNVVVGDILAKEFDIHYEIDSIGSVDEFSKN